MKQVTILLALSVISVSLSLSQDQEQSSKVIFTHVKHKPRCEGGLKKLNDLFTELAVQNEEAANLKLLQIIISNEGKVSVIESFPGLSIDALQAVTNNLNSIQWLPAHDENLPVNFITKLELSHENNETSVLNGYIDELQPYTLKGKIIDQNTHQAISNALVSVKYKNQSVFTNDNGEFMLFLTRRYTRDKFEVKHACYNEYEFLVQNLNYMTIPIEKTNIDLSTINVANSTPEKAPCNYASWNPDSGNTPNIWRIMESTSFVEGNDCFRNYISNGFIYPKNAWKVNYSGTVKVNFTINQEGIPENVSITGDIHHGIFEIVQSLIADMPIWKPAFQRNQPLEQDVTFAIAFTNNKFWTKYYKREKDKKGSVVQAQK